MRTLPVRSASALLFALAAAAAASESLQTQITRIEQRVAERPADFIAQTRLGDLRALEARQTGDLRVLAKAESAFQNALAEFPGHIGALAGLAGVRIALHRFDEAEELARKILAIDPDNEDGKLLLLDAQLARGAIDAAEHLASQLPDAPATLARRSELARLHGANEDAIKLALRAAEDADARGDSPENSATYRVRLGELYFRRGDFDAAELQYKQAETAWPESYSVLEHIAELRGAQTRFAEAEALYKKLIERSHRPDAAQALGDLYQYQGSARGAKPYYDQALAGYRASLDRGELHFIHHLAGYYSDVEQNGAEAVRWARKDLEMRQTPATHEALAWAMYRAGEFQASQREIDAALVSGIKDAHIFAHASFIYSAAGDLTKGEELRRAAEAINPHYNNFHVHR